MCYLLKRIEDRLQAMEERMDELIQAMEEWADMDSLDSDFLEYEVDEDSEESSNDEDSEAMVQD